METLASTIQDSTAVADTAGVIAIAPGVLPEFGLTYLVILGLTIAWLGGVTYFLVKLLKKYTFGNWESEENPKKNPYAGETFAMPRGVFRGIITLSLLFLVLLLEVANLQMHGLEEKIDKLLTAFEMMLAFYFGSKVMHHVTKADERKATGMSQKPAATTAGDFQSEDAVG